VRGIRSPTAKLVRRRADAVPRSVGESPVHLKSTIKPPEQGRPMVCRREPGSRFVSNGDYVKNAWISPAQWRSVRKRSEGCRLALMTTCYSGRKGCASSV